MNNQINQKGSKVLIQLVLEEMKQRLIKFDQKKILLNKQIFQENLNIQISKNKIWNNYNRKQEIYQSSQNNHNYQTVYSLLNGENEEIVDKKSKKIVTLQDNRIKENISNQYQECCNHEQELKKEKLIHHRMKNQTERIENEIFSCSYDYFQVIVSKGSQIC
ncbi:unnamed protein product [Paramecium pentaurelia]|uniref:Uncharacterized protein n=1 Tax=Paramecium pentaurelia TaxID=43138 RepID=A0A8S1YJU3_9CILI|nr:unnamed protein product [Paramecium pentaurelia]